MLVEGYKNNILVRGESLRDLLTSRVAIVNGSYVIFLRDLERADIKNYHPKAIWGVN